MQYFSCLHSFRVSRRRQGNIGKGWLSLVKRLAFSTSRSIPMKRASTSVAAASRSRRKTACCSITWRRMSGAWCHTRNCSVSYGAIRRSVRMCSRYASPASGGCSGTRLAARDSSSTLTVRGTASCRSATTLLSLHWDQRRVRQGPSSDGRERLALRRQRCSTLRRDSVRCCLSQATGMGKTTLIDHVIDRANPDDLGGARAVHQALRQRRAVSPCHGSIVATRSTCGSLAALASARAVRAVVVAPAAYAS